MSALAFIIELKYEDLVLQHRHACSSFTSGDRTLNYGIIKAQNLLKGMSRFERS